MDSGTTALITIQRDTNGTWSWQGYDRHGLKIATQEKLEDATQCIEEILKWLAFELTSDNPSQRPLAGESTASTSEAGKETNSTP